MVWTCVAVWQWSLTAVSLEGNGKSQPNGVDTCRSVAINLTPVSLDWYTTFRRKKAKKQNYIMFAGWSQSSNEKLTAISLDIGSKEEVPNGVKICRRVAISMTSVSLIGIPLAPDQKSKITFWRQVEILTFIKGETFHILFPQKPIISWLSPHCT